MRWTPGISTGPLKVMVVFLFCSSALAPGASIAPISATQHTVVAALNSFISFFSPFASDFVVRRSLRSGVMRISAGVPRVLHIGISGPVGTDSFVRSYMPAFGGLMQFEPSNEELTVRGHMTECGQWPPAAYLRSWSRLKSRLWSRALSQRWSWATRPRSPSQ